MWGAYCPWWHGRASSAPVRVSWLLNVDLCVFVLRARFRLW